MAAPELETARDLAARVGRSIRTTRTWTLRDDFPTAAQTGPRGVLLYRRADVDAWLAEHPRLAGPPPVSVDGDDDEWVTLNAFAERIGKASGTVYQYSGRPPAVENRYRLGDLRAWWASRPGQGTRTDKA
ncbi:helix-turn-helix transcriptional regulator [Parafrankia sp. FMc2]|uniref:helix-turn-helix transcriptional regulator n=1 Tax=Parafrankia sp. FMc2 TaxID=3233196 RepID=UPI0034D3CF90